MQPDPKPRLSPQETRVLNLLAWGYTPIEVAADMGVSVAWVRELAYSARDKLGARTMFETAVIATHTGLITEDIPTPVGIEDAPKAVR